MVNVSKVGGKEKKAKAIQTAKGICWLLASSVFAPPLHNPNKKKITRNPQSSRQPSHTKLLSLITL
jgi:hypothetical protein